MGHHAQNGTQGEPDVSRLGRLENRLDHVVALLENMVGVAPVAKPPAGDMPPPPSQKNFVPLPTPIVCAADAAPIEADGRANIIRPASFPAARARFARESLRRRRKRNEYFPAELFADPCWDILLDLYAAHYEGEAVSVSSLCIAAAVPQTTALRWINMMTIDGWLNRLDDPADRRRAYIKLSEDARRRLDAYFDNLPY